MEFEPWGLKAGNLACQCSMCSLAVGAEECRQGSGCLADAQRPQGPDAASWICRAQSSGSAEASAVQQSSVTCGAEDV